jgi:hypothetical protein
LQRGGGLHCRVRGRGQCFALSRARDQAADERAGGKSQHGPDDLRHGICHTFFLKWVGPSPKMLRLSAPASAAV